MQNDSKVFGFGASFERFCNNLMQKFEPPVRYHLAKVYLCLVATTHCTTFGSLLHITKILETGIIAAIGSLILVLLLHFYKDNGKNFLIRLSLLLGFGFCSGQTLGPLLDYILFLNPAIIVTALTGTVVVFLSLTCAALLAEHGKYLFLGGILVSVLNTMALLSIFNIFIQSCVLKQIHLYVSLFVMTAFIVFDTQNIIEKHRSGDCDCIQHSLDLFFDLISMFRRLLIIITQKMTTPSESKILY